MRFSGVMTALVTPFEGGGLDRNSLSGLVDRQLEAGVDGLVVNGTTAESPTLTGAEQAEALALVVERVAGRVAVVAGVGSNSTAATVARAKEAEALGATGLLVVNPYYNKPTQAGQRAHFQAVAEAVGIPLCLYNIPGRTAAGLTVESLARLSQVPGIVAVKEATADLRFASEILQACSPGFAVLSGDDFTFLPLLSVGGHGIIAAGGNLIPERFVALWRAASQGDYSRARAVHQEMLPLLQVLYAETNPIPVKTACAWAGLIASPEMRLPLTPLSEEVGVRLREVMRAAGLPWVGGTA